MTRRDDPQVFHGPAVPFDNDARTFYGPPLPLDDRTVSFPGVVFAAEGQSRDARGRAVEAPLPSASRSSRIDQIARHLLAGDEKQHAATFTTPANPPPPTVSPRPDTATLAAAEHKRLLEMMVAGPRVPQGTQPADTLTPGLRQWLGKSPRGRALVAAEDKRLADEAAARAGE